MDARLGSPARLRTLLLALAGCVAAGVLVAWAPTQLLASARVAPERRAEIAAAQLAGQLEVHLLDRIDAIRRLTQPPTRSALQSKDAYQHVVEPILALHPDLQALNRVDRDHVIQWVVPLEGNEPALRADLSAHPLAGPVLAEATTTRRPRVTAPLELLQGGYGIAIYVPLFDSDEAFDGALNAVFRIRPLIESSIQLRAGDTYDVVLRDGEWLLYESASGVARETTAYTAPIAILNRQWTLELHPRDD